MTTTATQHLTCRRCGRPLTSPRSIREALRNGGYGRGCAHKITENARAAALTETPAQLAKAVDLVTDGGLVHTGHLYLAVSSDGSTRYEVTETGECTCRAAQFGRRCYHAIAAQLVA